VPLSLNFPQLDKVKPSSGFTPGLRSASFLQYLASILNQFKGHWLLSDARHFAISINLKLREKQKNAPSFQTLMENDLNVALRLICLASNI
jgi:hypothetical protein